MADSSSYSSYITTVRLSLDLLKRYVRQPGSAEELADSTTASSSSSTRSSLPSAMPILTRVSQHDGDFRQPVEAHFATMMSGLPLTVYTAISFILH